VKPEDAWRSSHVKECNQCGKCCINYSNGGLSALPSEIDYWEAARPDIYRYVSAGNIWVDPGTGQQLVRCPWLRQLPDQEKYICDIYYDRPDDCKHYPVTIEQMVNDECEMLEVQDLAKPRQAQESLDRLMADSRPALM
jgi:Fe-S-cluster containining protein